MSGGQNREQLLELLAAGVFTFYKEVMEICKNFVITFVVADHCVTVKLRRAPTNKNSVRDIAPYP